MGLDLGITHDLPRRLMPRTIFNSSHLAEMLGHFRHVIECVVLNACHSEAQLAEIARHVPAILGTNASLDDRAAVLLPDPSMAAWPMARISMVVAGDVRR
jgi:hypothetical protein